MEVSGISVEKAQEIANSSIVSGTVDSAGNLVLTNGAGAEVNAGQTSRVTREIEIYTPETSSAGSIWTKSTNATRVRIILFGGGGGGGGNGSTHGGPGGAVIDITVPASFLDATEVVTVGTGGAGASAAGIGASGGSSSFTMKNETLRATGGYDNGFPGFPRIIRASGDDEMLVRSAQFMFGESDPDTESLDGYRPGGGGGFGQTNTEYTSGGRGHFGLTDGGTMGTGPSILGRPGVVTEGIAGGGGGIPSSGTSAGHGGYPGGGGARGGPSAGGGDGGAAAACIITYFDID